MKSIKFIFDFYWLNDKIQYLKINQFLEVFTVLHINTKNRVSLQFFFNLPCLNTTWIPQEKLEFNAFLNLVLIVKNSKIFGELKKNNHENISNKGVAFFKYYFAYKPKNEIIWKILHF